MEPRSKPGSTGNGRIRHPELFRALRGIWKLKGEEVVVEVDQETGELMACTYEGEAVDPVSVVARGTQVRPFEKHSPGN